ncbi:hypothetical protein, partial [Streptomyces sp. SID5785]|uniref:hypothetical protein n=1 Tax=Streptomyces sp. SID5785 TaxID=2690309 RepID=UPI001927190E
IAGCVGVQAALHAALSLAQAGTRAESGHTLARRWIAYLLCTGPGAPVEGLPAGTGPAMHAAHAMPGMTVPGQDMSAMSSAGMLAAHLLAAALCGVWLARGEKAAFDALRAVASRLSAPLRLPLLRVVPARGPRSPLRRPSSDPMPRRLLTTRTITSRGPPAPVAVA